MVADSDQLPELVHDSLEAIEKAAAELGPPDQGHEQFPEPQHNLTDDVLAYVEKLLKGGLADSEDSRARRPGAGLFECPTQKGFLVFIRSIGKWL